MASNRPHPSKRKEARQEAEDSIKTFRSVFEHISIPLVTFNKSGKVLDWNKPFAGLLQTLGGTLKRTSFYENLILPKEHRRMRDFIKAVFQGETLVDHQWKGKSSMGEPLDLVISIFPAFDWSGDISYGIAMIIDITKKKELERALLHTEKMAAMGTLASGLAHELGTPMNVILGRSESLLRQTQEEKTAKGLMIIIEQIDRMTHLINRLLAFARKTPMDRKKVDLNQLIRKGIEIVEHQTQKRRIRVQTQLHPNLSPIWGDGNQIVQILVNLLMNSADAIHNGGTISITTSLLSVNREIGLDGPSVVKKHRAVQILLKDTGCGIAPANLDKIFDPFFTTKPVGKGTGLGLAVVSGIVREHGGRIEVTSIPGQGSTFCISLPAER
ncbi:MAG: nitrogen regulation protein NR(II) [Nitrospiria bacterium]